MKTFFPTVVTLAVILSGCDRGEERITVEETRPKTTKDSEPRLFATSDERFKNTQPSPVVGDAPESWLALPSTQFRLLNYRFGESGTGEVYVSISSGGVFENVNRWLRQFGKEGLNAGEFSAMERIPVAGVEGVWVEATGEYGSGMGSRGGAKPGYGLAGVVADTGGKILTVKMLGPAQEVEEERERLREYIGSLRLKQD